MKKHFGIGEVSSLELLLAMAATIGYRNIVGVATASWSAAREPCFG